MPTRKLTDWSCFNEAAGIHRRKRPPASIRQPKPVLASMRPPEFTGGNLAESYGCTASNIKLQ